MGRSVTAGLKIFKGGTNAAVPLELPCSAATEVITFLATRGAGKSFAAADIAEEVYAAAIQFVVVDPMGVFWGLRSSRDGSKPGLGVIILGGERGDVPLEPTSGTLIADVVVDTGQSFVLDLSLFDSKADQVKFMSAFCERIFYRKGPIEKRTPLMIIVDEADEFAPQKPEKNETVMLSHMIRLAKRGRTRGIGLVPLTQRSAEFHKGILDLSSAVVFMRTAGPRDRKAIKDWLKGSAPELIELVDQRFPKLDTGSGLVYSPHWLKLEEPLEVKFRLINTYDSYKTPEPGEERQAPAKTAAIDLAALGEQIAATVERAKENDPAELRKRIRDLEQQLKTSNTPRARDEAFGQIKAELEQEVADLKEQLAERAPVELSAEQEAELKRLIERWEEVGGLPEQIIAMAETFREHVRALANNPTLVTIAELLSNGRPAAPPRLNTTTQRETRPAPPPRPGPEAAKTNGVSGGANSSVSQPQQKLLDALAWFEAVGVPAPRKSPLAAVAGVSSKSSGFRANISALSGLGLVSYPQPGHVALTEEGRGVARPPAYMGTPAELQEAVYRTVSGPQADLLRVLVAAYPDPVDRETLAERAGVSANSSGFRANVSKLSGFETITYPAPGYVRAADLLFLGDAVPA